MFNRVIPKLKLQRLALFNLQDENGQSMVEMTIITPILIFLLIGVFEVGYAIRGYLVLANVSREITRFAIRPGYLDFASEESTADSYQKVRDWVDVTLSDQLVMDFDPNVGNATLIVSHVVVDTGLPCKDISTNPGACDCDAFLTDPNYARTFDLDDLIIHPNKVGMEFQTQRFGPATSSTGPKETRINYDKLVAQELIPQNNKFNCELIKKSGLPSTNNVIITELFLDQPQLFGFPVISNAFTDPVPLYAHTVMRLIKGTRSNGSTAGGIAANVNTLGPICDAYPFVVHESTIAGKLNQRVDIFDGPGGSDFGWLAWNPTDSTGSNAAPYIRNELKYSTMALNDFIDARDPSDTTLSVGDYVASFGGVEATAESSDHLVSALIGKKIRIPVWDSFHHGTGGQRDAYHIPAFAWVRIESASDINLSGKKVYATYLGDATDSCPLSDTPVSNHSPLAMNDAATTNPNTQVTINVLSNDSDSDGDTLTITSVGTPGQGNVTLNGSSVIYTPSAGFSGSDSFTYTISDGSGGTDTATVTITINGGAAGNNPPVAADDTATTDQNTPVTISIVGNDSDPDGDSLSISSVGTPSTGTAVNNGNGTITYTPNAGFSGTANFTYVVSDGHGGTDTAIVTVTVNATNAPPVAVSDTAMTNQNTPVSINVLANDSDPDGDSLTVQSAGTPGHGNVVINGDGTITYTPTSGYNGPDSFTYTVNDGSGGTATATVTMTVAAPVCTETELFVENFSGGSLSGARWADSSGSVNVSSGYVTLYNSNWADIETVVINASGFTNIKLSYDIEMINTVNNRTGAFYLQARQRESWGWNGWSNVGSTLYERFNWTSKTENLSSAYEDKEIRLRFRFRRDVVRLDNIRVVGTSCQ